MDFSKGIWYATNRLNATSEVCTWRFNVNLNYIVPQFVYKWRSDKNVYTLQSVHRLWSKSERILNDFVGQNSNSAVSFFSKIAIWSLRSHFSHGIGSVLASRNLINLVCPQSGSCTINNCARPAPRRTKFSPDFPGIRFFRNFVYKSVAVELVEFRQF